MAVYAAGDRAVNPRLQRALEVIAWALFMTALAIGVVAITANPGGH